MLSTVTPSNESIHFVIRLNVPKVVSKIVEKCTKSSVRHHFQNCLYNLVTEIKTFFPHRPCPPSPPLQPPPPPNKPWWVCKIYIMPLKWCCSRVQFQFEISRQVSWCGVFNFGHSQCLWRDGHFAGCRLECVMAISWPIWSVSTASSSCILSKEKHEYGNDIAWNDILLIWCVFNFCCRGGKVGVRGGGEGVAVSCKQYFSPALVQI